VMSFDFSNRSSARGHHIAVQDRAEFNISTVLVWVWLRSTSGSSGDWVPGKECAARVLADLGQTTTNQTLPRPKTLRPYLSSNTLASKAHPTAAIRAWHRGRPQIARPHSAHPRDGLPERGRCPAKKDGVPESSRMSKLTSGKRTFARAAKSCVDGFLEAASPLQLSGLCRPRPSTGAGLAADLCTIISQVSLTRCSPLGGVGCVGVRFG
jgi:hypothetical protein